MDVDLTEVPGGRVDLPRDEGIEVDDALNEMKEDQAPEMCELLLCLLTLLWESIMNRILEQVTLMRFLAESHWPIGLG